MNVLAVNKNSFKVDYSSLLKTCYQKINILIHRARNLRTCQEYTKVNRAFPKQLLQEAIDSMIIPVRLQFHVLPLGRPWMQVWIGKQDFPVAGEEALPPPRPSVFFSRDRARLARKNPAFREYLPSALARIPVVLTSGAPLLAPFASLARKSLLRRRNPFKPTNFLLSCHSSSSSLSVRVRRTFHRNAVRFSSGSVGEFVRDQFLRWRAAPPWRTQRRSPHPVHRWKNVSTEFSQGMTRSRGCEKRTRTALADRRGT